MKAQRAATLSINALGLEGNDPHNDNGHEHNEQNPIDGNLNKSVSTEPSEPMPEQREIHYSPSSAVYDDVETHGGIETRTDTNGGDV